ncbi:MAG: efflux transporter periplasmic adaptor subunit [Rhizobacter sp.]|nr:efflux transporter periplasmic adaptor subunit [Rhizobacter sp.]
MNRFRHSPALSFTKEKSFHSTWLLTGILLLMAMVTAACTSKDAAQPASASAAQGQASGASSVSGATGQPVEVGVRTLKSERLAVDTELPGRTVAPLVAEIRPQVGGIVQKRLFTEGSQVKAGQVLYQLDTATYDAALASARASVRKAESTLATAKVVAQRNQELVKIDAISQQANDESLALAQQAEADLGVARAAEQTARINLGFTRIVAPISGWVELSQVTPGALVTAGQATALTTVRQLDPLHVHVTQSSSELLRLKRELASGLLKSDGAQSARVRLTLEDGSAYPHEGRLTFSGVTVDTGTGAVTLRAVVPNPNGLLMPGMYVKAVLQEGVDADALLVPQQAVTRSADGSASTLVVEPNGKLATRAIKVGRAVGNRWQALDGLKAGDRVLIEGSQRAKVGDMVTAVEVDTAGSSAELASAGTASPASNAVSAR